MAGEVIRIQPLGGAWETLGADRLRGLVAEHIVAKSNDWGPDELSFNLRAEAGARRPDLLPFTPIDLEVDGFLCWSGFVWQRPSDANGYQVGCRGWQYHLDDDLLDRAYVHTRLSDYVDDRSLLSSDLGVQIATAMVVNGEGGITLGFPQGSTIAAGKMASATFDAGPDSRFIRAVITARTTFNAALGVFAMCHDSPWWGTDTVIGGTRDDFISGALLNAAPWTAANQDRTFAATIPTARRYVTLGLYSGAGTGVLGSDVAVKFTAVQLFRSASYESGNASILKADTVIKDVLAAKLPLLNQSTAKISAGTFSLPSYLTSGYVTPRTIVEAANVVENYRLKIGGADLRTLVYDLRPSAPIAEVGDWSGSEFTDATISGEPINNKAIIDATGPDGARFVSKRASALTSEAPIGTSTSGTVGSNTGPTQLLVGAFTPSASKYPEGFRAGVPFLVSILDGSVTSAGTAQTWRVRIGGNVTNDTSGPPTDYVEFNYSFSDTDTVGQPPFQQLLWFPKQNYTALIYEFFLVSGTINAWSVVHRIGRGPTAVDRRVFARATRLDVNAALTSAVADRIADLYLTEHLTAPFSGTLKIIGAGARRVLTGTSIPPHEFLVYAGEKIRLANRLNPDTGEQGRDGRIAGVTYDHDARAVEIAIDDQRKKFETILARYAALVGG